MSPAAQDVGVAGGEGGVDEDTRGHVEPRVPGELHVGRDPHADDDGVGVDHGAVAEADAGDVLGPLDGVDPDPEAEVHPMGRVELGEEPSDLGAEDAFERGGQRVDHAPRRTHAGGRTR